MSDTAPQPAPKPPGQISLANITGAPATTMIGLALVLQTIAANLPADGGWPHTPAQWANLAVSVLLGLGGALHK